MSPSAAEVRRTQLEAELLVEGVQLCAPRTQGLKAAVRWIPEDPKRAGVMVRFLLKHGLEFSFSYENDDVEIHVRQRPRAGYASEIVEVGETDWLVFDGKRVEKFSPYTFDREWELL